MHYIRTDYIDNLFDLTWDGLKSGLQHIQKYLQQKGNVHEDLQVFHIAGTNGKWSTAQMLSQVLWKQFGKKVWLFLSPHLIDISERIQINGQKISYENLNRLIWEIYEETKDFFPFSYFEILTLVAVRYFLDEEVDYAVFEVGLWWTLDSTNIWSSPLATFITSIWMDHMRLLGSSLSQIQWNKMGIMKENVPCYTPIDNKLMHWGAKVKKADLHIITESIATNLPGIHQEQNAALVYYCLDDLGYPEDQLKNGLMQIEHPGRLQYIRHNILVDGAHNLQWIQALKVYIDSNRHKRNDIVTVFGSSKSTEEVIFVADNLIQGNENWLVQPSVYRWLDPELYQDIFSVDNLHIQKNLSVLLNKLVPSLKDDTLLLIYGSLYLVAEAIKMFDNYFWNLE